MNKTQRFAVVGALAAITTLSVAACSNGESASTDSGSSATSAAAPTTTSEAPTTTEAPSSSSAGGGSADGVTKVSDIFGPACDMVPKSGPGSAAGMVDAAVGTAAGNNPLFKTLTTAVKAVGLESVLNDTSKSFTVFGPVDSAFAALPAGTLDKLLADPKGDLTKILSYHVIPKRYDAAGLVKAGKVSSVEGGDVMITGTADAPMINGNPVLCGNIPTANATVFAIGKVLTPPAA